MPAALSPVLADSDLVSYVVKAGGDVIDDRYEILAIEIEHALNRIPSATLVIRDGDVAAETFVAAAGSDFAPGTEIEIQLGYHDDVASVFKGLVLKSAVSRQRHGHATFTVTCRDAADALTIGRRSAVHAATTDSAVISKLVSACSGLTASVTSTSQQFEELTQFAASDWDFILSRAEANGFVVSVAAGTVTIGAPALSGSPVLGVTYGYDLQEFSLEEDARTQLSSVAGTSWDPSTQAVVTSSASLSSAPANPLGSDSGSTLAGIVGSQPFPLQTSAALPSGELQTWGQAQLLKSSLAKIRGTLVFQGSSSAVPDALIAVSGLGDRFDGNAYISGVHHEVRDGNWLTTATVGLRPDWFAARPDVSAPPASALLPGVAGLQIGVVKQIDSDPANQFRVLVTVPTIDSTGQGLWARLARPYATTNAGNFFYPEVGDEVVLAFLDDDPRFPVIVGSLYSSQLAAPFTPDAKNSTKAIITKAQLKVLFDEEKKVLTLSTPGGQTVVLSDDQKSITLTDQNSNSVKLGTDGITLTSASDVVIKAAQNITLEAQSGSLSAKGTQGVTVTGLKISLSADTEFAASGNASAALTASGETTVKGAVVMIN